MVPIQYRTRIHITVVREIYFVVQDEVFSTLFCILPFILYIFLNRGITLADPYSKSEEGKMSHTATSETRDESDTWSFWATLGAMVFIGTLFATVCGIVMALFSVNGATVGASITMSGIVVGIALGFSGIALGFIFFIIGEVVEVTSGIERAEKYMKKSGREMFLGIGFVIGVPICSFAIAYIIAWVEAGYGLFVL